jgi:hypothetical protein
MPKIDIDYSNTIIYKITCKDSNVTDVYVGHTTNFVQKKYAHKKNCNNDKTVNHSKLYEVIRNNGGWQNWNMEIINLYNCHDHYEARQKEQEYFILLNATLNDIEPMPKAKAKTMKNTAQPSEKPTLEKNAGENADIFSCDQCDFKCSKKSNYEIHLGTRKHKILTNPNILFSKNAEQPFECNQCHKTYKHASTLSSHKKKCVKPVPLSVPAHPSIFNKNISGDLGDPNSLTLMVVELIKSNQELQKQMLEVCKVGNSTINNNNNNNSHSHNKTFNMQFFLNEQCKDAMNIMDFVNTFQLDFSDLEKVGEVGYVEGMSTIIIKKLNEMDIYKRPIHCSDAKRETMFVKDKDVWEKDNGNHDKLRLAIKHISKKNTDMLNKWSAAHPGSCDSDNYLNDVYMEIVMQAMGGRGGREENENKIMRRIAKSCLIDKDM